MTTALLLLTTFRLTWLATRDEFPPLIRLRGVVADRWGEQSWQSYLSTCGWCASVYVAAGVVAAALILGLSLPLPLLWVPAMSATTGILITFLNALGA